MRVAALDIGTNTVLMLVAERLESGELVALRDEARITRLGEGVDATRTLAPAAIARTSACLEEYAGLLGTGVERVGVVGTSAMRDAGGGEAIRARVKELFGVEARTISGDEEARLTFRGALSGLDAHRSSSRVFDIGGGSTEVVVGDSTNPVGFSFDVGSVRLTERLVKADPPTPSEIDAMRRTIREAFAARPEVWAAANALSSPPVGIAGTVTTLAAVHLGLVPYDGSRVHGLELALADITRLRDELVRLPLAERRLVRGLEPKRADVIVAGVLLVEEVMAAFQAASLVVSDRGVRWGLAEELANA